MMANHRLAILTCLWLLVTSGFFLFRSSTPLLVWSDSPALSANLYGSYGLGPRHTFNEPGVTRQIFLEYFQGVTTTGYRPVNFIIHNAGVAFLARQGLARISGLR